MDTPEPILDDRIEICSQSVQMSAFYCSLQIAKFSIKQPIITYLFEDLALL